MPEVLIIGAGVIGLSIARELHKSGVREIAIIERGRAGEEASWAAAGMLSPNVEAQIGSEFHAYCRQSLEMYPIFAAELLEETGVDIELDQSGTMFVAFDDEDGGSLLGEYRRLRDAGINVETLSKEEILKAEPELSSLVQTGILYPNDWQVENRKLLIALWRYAELNNIAIVENTTIDELIIEGGSVLGGRNTKGEFVAEKTILATGAWTSLIKFDGSPSSIDIKPVRGQMICFQPEERLLEKVIYGPSCYLVPRADGRILAGSTTEYVGFDKSVTPNAIEALRSAAGDILPALRALEIADSWAGLRPTADDELPVIGMFVDLKDLVIATGHYRNGILLAPLTAKIIVDEHYPSVFSPDRFGTNRNAALV